MGIGHILLLGFEEKKIIDEIPEDRRSEIIVEKTAGFSGIKQFDNYGAVLINGNDSGSDDPQKRRIERQEILRHLSQTSIRQAVVQNPKDIIRHLNRWMKKAPTNNIPQSLREFIAKKDRENEKALGKKRLPYRQLLLYLVQEAQKEFNGQKFTKALIERVLVDSRSIKSASRKIGIDESF